MPGTVLILDLGFRTHHHPHGKPTLGTTPRRPSVGPDPDVPLLGGEKVIGPPLLEHTPRSGDEAFLAQVTPLPSHRARRGLCAGSTLPKHVRPPGCPRGWRWAVWLEHGCVAGQAPIMSPPGRDRRRWGAKEASGVGPSHPGQPSRDP